VNYVSGASKSISVVESLLLESTSPRFLSQGATGSQLRYAPSWGFPLHTSTPTSQPPNIPSFLHETHLGPLTLKVPKCRINVLADISVRIYPSQRVAAT
jgi:hypothetical protein